MIRLEKALKISWPDVLKTSSKRLENVLKTSWRRILKTNILVLTKTSSRHLEDVFWRRKAKANIFVLIKTSWRRLEDVFIKMNYCWVVPVFKNDLKLHYCNYRPICLSWNIEKILEKLYKRLYTFHNNNKIIYNLQFDLDNNILHVMP